MLHHFPSQLRIVAPPDMSSGLHPILVRWRRASRLVGTPSLPHGAWEVTWEVRRLIFPLPHSPRRGSLARPLTLHLTTEGDLLRAGQPYGGGAAGVSTGRSIMMVRLIGGVPPVLGFAGGVSILAVGRGPRMHVLSDSAQLTLPHACLLQDALGSSPPPTVGSGPIPSCDVADQEGATCPCLGCCQASDAFSAAGSILGACPPDWARPSGWG